MEYHLIKYRADYHHRPIGKGETIMKGDDANGFLEHIFKNHDDKYVFAIKELRSDGGGIQLRMN